MAKINLLPWRQELRKQRQQEFIAIVGAVAALAVAIILFAHMALSKQVSDQEERNQYIKAEIAKLDSQITEIDALQKRREELMSRMKVIQDLQGRRPMIVRVFDELVRVIPDGVHLKSVVRKEDRFTITGVAEAPNQVSSLMRNLDASPWFKSPQLSTVASDQVAAGKAQEKDKGAERQQGNRFELTVLLELPEESTEAESGGKKDEKDSKAGGAK